MTTVASKQVNAQKRRLIAARAIDESEKRMYVKVQYVHVQGGGGEANRLRFFSHFFKSIYC